MSIKRVLPPDVRQAARKQLDAIGQQVAERLEHYIVPDEKIEKVVEYAIKMVCDSPQMKIDRIIRKTVEQFKLNRREANTLKAV